METKQLLHYLEQKDKLPKESSAYLQEVTQNFPYFQTANILYAKSLFDHNDSRFEAELRRTAISVFSRKKLYDYIHFQPENYFITTETEEPPTEEILKPTTTKTEIELTEKVEEKIAEIQSPEANETTETKETPPKEDNKKEIDPLEKQYISNAIGLGYLESFEIEEAEPKQDKIAVEPEITKDATQDNTLTIAPNPETFSQWVSFFDTGKIGEDTTEKTTAKSIDELISKVEERKNTPIKKVPFFSAEEMAKKSVQEDENLITETLANIYYQQENYEKALKAYKKLSLKYPEKSIYFAAQIKLIKKKLNN